MLARLGSSSARCGSGPEVLFYRPERHTHGSRESKHGSRQRMSLQRADCSSDVCLVRPTRLEPKGDRTVVGCASRLPLALYDSRLEHSRIHGLQCTVQLASWSAVDHLGQDKIPGRFKERFRRAHGFPHSTEVFHRLRGKSSSLASLGTLWGPSLFGDWVFRVSRVV
jgi:hypothetical protein